MSEVEEVVVDRLLNEAKVLQSTMRLYSNVFIDNSYRGVGPQARRFYELLWSLENYLNATKGKTNEERLGKED